MPVFEGPTRDDRPIPERECNLLAFAFPKIYQTGVGDLYADRLRSLDENGQDPLDAYTTHCHFYFDYRFVKHPRILYLLFNRSLRLKLLKTKSFFMKYEQPSAADFLSENKPRTMKKMQAHTAKLPTTPAYKNMLRHQVENMTDQIQHGTANKARDERVMMDEEFEDYLVIRRRGR